MVDNQIKRKRITANCPKCNSRDLTTYYYIDGKTNVCTQCGHEFHPPASIRKIIDYSIYKEIRSEKVEEIRIIWDSPKFRTNNERLIHLLRHCKNIEYGYTIREFAHARFPEKMAPEPKDENDYLWGQYYAFNALHQMFRRFRKDMTNHEVVLAAIYRKLEKESVGRWYYYNLIDDEKAMREVKLRGERCTLRLERAREDLKGIGEMSEEDYAVLQKKHLEEIEAKIEYDIVRKKKGPNSKSKSDPVQVSILDWAKQENGTA